LKKAENSPEFSPELILKDEEENDSFELLYRRGDEDKDCIIDTSEISSIILNTKKRDINFQTSFIGKY
jgi:hypothetical protein